MIERVLTDAELTALVERYQDVPGIVRGIILEHVRRGGPVALALWRFGCYL